MIQIISMRGAAVLGLVLAGATLGGCDQFQQGFDTQWREEFVKSCTSTATSQGADTTLAANYCNCSADKVIEKLPGVTDRANPDEAVLREAAEACLSEMMGGAAATPAS